MTNSKKKSSSEWIMILDLEVDCFKKEKGHAFGDFFAISVCFPKAFWAADRNADDWVQTTENRKYVKRC